MQIAKKIFFIIWIINGVLFLGMGTFGAFKFFEPSKDFMTKQASFSKLYNIPRSDFGYIKLLDNLGFVKNLLFVDLKNDQSFWLLKDDKNRILEHNLLSNNNKNIAFIYLFEDENQARSIALSHDDARGLKTIEKDVEELLDYAVNEDEINIFYTKKSAVFVMKIKIDGLIAIKKVKLTQ